MTGPILCWWFNAKETYSVVPNNSLCLLIYFDFFAGLLTLYLCLVPAYSLVGACTLDSKGVSWHQAPGWFDRKCIINCFEEKIWVLTVIVVVFQLDGLPIKLYIHTNKCCSKNFFGNLHFIQIDTLCCYSSLHCRVHFKMCHPTLLYGPILLVILRNVPPYSVISHSSVIWNSGVTPLLTHWSYISFALSHQCLWGII